MPEGKQLLPEPGRGRVGRVTDELFDKLFRRWREKDWESGQPPPSGPSAEAAARAKPVGSGKSTGVSKAQQRAEDHLTLQEIGPQLEGLMRPKEFGFPKVDPPPEAPEAPTPGETLGRIGPQLEGLMHPKEFPESAETPKLAVQRLEGEIKELKQSLASDPPKKDPDSEEDPFDVREVELLLKESDLREAQEELKRLAEEAEGPPAKVPELPEPGSDEFYRHGNQGTIPEKLAEVPPSAEWQAIAEARFPNNEIDGGGHVKNPEIIPVKPLARMKGATASIKLAETDEGTWAMAVDKKIDNKLGGGDIHFDPTTFPTREAAIRQAIDTIKHWFNSPHVSSKFKDELGPLNESLDKWLEEYFAKPEGQGDVSLGTRQFVSGLERTPTDMKSVIEGGAQVGIKIGMGERLSAKVRKQIIEHVEQGGQVFVEHGLYGPKFDTMLEADRGKAFTKFFKEVHSLWDTESSGGKPVVPGNVQHRKLDDIKPGGLGTFFIKQIMDGAVFKKDQQGWVNHLVLTKKI